MLNPRQVSVYLYLSLLCSDDGTCHPTTKQIRQDLGIASLTIVFEAISALEHGGFILRHREHLIALKSRRNVYRRPSCEFTILRLLETGRIDALLRPTPGSVNEMTYPARELRDDWLENILAGRWKRFHETDDAGKMTLLMGAVRLAVEQNGMSSAAGD